MNKLKVLNLYAGLGGNRFLWKNCEVTAVENNPHIAALYAKKFPRDLVLVEDAHEHLIRNYRKYDFIWSSVPCHDHSVMKIIHFDKNPQYTDLSLYQEILFLKFYSKKRFVVENVAGFYVPLYPVDLRIGRNVYWTSSTIQPIEFYNFPGQGTGKVRELEYFKKKLNWLKLPYSVDELRLPKLRTRTLIDNCIHPIIGNYIYTSINRL